jgi:hypothetical protein
MAPPPHTMQLTGGADWALMTAIHDALRRDLDHQLPAPARLLYRTVWLPRYARTTPPL